MDEMSRVENESVLRQVEAILKKAKAKGVSTKKDFSEFVGLLTNKEADEMQKIIDDGCENIDWDGWK